MIEQFAFLKLKCSYDENIEHLSFVNREEIHGSKTITHKIPIRHLHVNDNYKTILLCHGIASDIGEYDLKSKSEKFSANICVFDFAGYGLHSCKVSSEAHCQKDVIAVYEYLVNEKNINPNNICIFGRSLGSGIACFLAHHLKDEEKQPQKLILVSPLESAARVVLKNMVSPVDIFMNYVLAPEIKCSTLILHGDKDNIVPYACGQHLSTKFQNLHKFYTLCNCDHVNIYTSEYYSEINEFLQL